MILNELKELFIEYEKLSAEAELVFDKVKESFTDCVRCEEQCSDCCHAIFDLSLIESIYLNKEFKNAFGYGKERSDILEFANMADRRASKLKRQLNKEVLEGKSPEDILAMVSQERQRCPLLGADERCSMYAKRPITCKIYGIPTTINGKSGSCSRSAFKAGQPYPSVNLDRIQDRLAELSKRIAPLVNSSYSELHLVYVPVSTALLTNYDASYLGAKSAQNDADKKDPFEKKSS